MDGCIVVDSTLIPAATPLLSGSKVTNLPCADLSHGLGALEVFVSNPSSINLVWSTGNVASVINNLMPGNYSVQVNSNLGCKDSAFFVITTPDSLYSNTTPTDLRCFGDSSGLILSTVSGGTLPYTYLWSNGDSSQYLLDVDTGFYALTLVDSMACVLRLDSLYIDQP